MSQSKKVNPWDFGRKAHIGVDARSALVHTAGVTTGKTHDARVMDNLIREDDRVVFADKSYVNENKKRAAAVGQAVDRGVAVVDASRCLHHGHTIIRPA